MNALTLGTTAGWLQKLRLFFASGWGMATQFALAALVVVFRVELPGMIGFVLLFSALMVLCENLLTSATPFLLAALFMITANGKTAYADFLPYWWLAFFPAGGMIAHAALYRCVFVRGRATWAIVAVSIAVTLGGVGVLSAKEYFAGVSLFHIIALGFGQLLAYLWLSSAVRQDTTGELPRFVSNLMVCVGLFACFMILHVYLMHLPQLIKEPHVLAFQWRNNVSTFLMLALPFPFYKAFHRPAWLCAALPMYIALLLSGSRGGMLFGTVELAMCVLFVLLADKKRRLLYLGIAVLLLIAAVVCMPLVFSFFWPTLRRILQSIFDGDSEVRMGLYRRAIEDFLTHPALGVGIGYMGNRDIHPSKQFALCWYHCAPLQIIGSMGVVGAAAYLFQYIVRCMIFLRRRTKFHLTLFLAWAGLEMMSLVNPGVFAPIPYLLLITMFLVFAEKTEAPIEVPAEN
jgi:hypothetical protein